MPHSSYPHGWANGVVVRGLPLLTLYPGEVFWVDSTNGSNGNKGTFTRPFATIDFAIGRCTAGRGDLVVVKPGYSQTITAAAEIALDVAGVAVIGLGTGSNRPTISHNHANTTIAVTAANCLWMNMRHLSDVTAVAIGFDVDATDFTLKGCEFSPVATGTDEFVITVDLGAGSHRALIEDNVIDNGIGGAAVGVKLTGASNFVTIRGNTVWGDYSTGCINGITTLSGNVDIRGNTLFNGIGGDLNTVAAIVLLTGTTGVIAENFIATNVASDDASVTADTCVLFENWYSETVASGVGIATTYAAVT